MMRVMLLALSLGAGCSSRPTWGFGDSEGCTPPQLQFFVGTDCPVSNFYAPEIERLSQGAFGVWLIYSEPGITDAAAEKHAREFRLSAMRILDDDQAFARRCGVTRIPTAVLALPDGEIVYRGRIDDRYTPEGKRRAEPRTRDLEAAIEAVLGGRRPEVKETPVFGCPLVLKEGSR